MKIEGPPTRAQVTFDLADRPVLAPNTAMQLVDLIGGEHGAISVIRQKPAPHSTLLLARFRSWRFAAEVLPEPRLGPN
jgi:hypothetical protein